MTWTADFLSSSSQTRFVLHSQDFIYFREDQMNHIDYFLLYDLESYRRIFVYITSLEKAYDLPHDEVLGLLFWRFKRKSIIVDLPGIRKKRLYMLSVSLFLR